MKKATFGCFFIEDFIEILYDLYLGLNAPHHIHGFFSSTGWDISGLDYPERTEISNELSILINKIDDFSKKEFNENYILDLIDAIKEEYKFVNEKNINYSFPNIEDKHIVEFNNDITKYLFIIFISKNYPFIFLLSELLGLITYERQNPILFNNIMIRKPIYTYKINTEMFPVFPVSIIGSALSEIELNKKISLDIFVKKIKNKFDVFMKKMHIRYPNSLKDGVEIIINTRGLYINSDLFNISEIKSPSTFKLPPDEKISLNIKDNGYSEIIWEEMIEDTNRFIPFISVDGIKLKLGESDVSQANSELRFYLSTSDSYLDLEGSLSFQLPTDIITGIDGDLSSSGNFIFHYSNDNNYSLKLTKLISQGDLQFGGSNGIRLSDGKLTIDDLIFSKPKVDTSLKIHFFAKLDWENNASTNNKIEVKGNYENNLLTLDSTGDLHLGNGIWLHPISDQQAILHTNIDTSSSGELVFEVNALFKIPHETEGTTNVEVSGELVLNHINGDLHLNQFKASNKVSNLAWELPGGIKLKNANLDIIYQNNQFVAAIYGKLELDDDSSIQIDAALAFPNTNHPENIQINTRTEVAGVNLFNQLYIYSGKLELNVTTQPLSGKLAIIDAKADFLPKNRISVSPNSSDFYIGIHSLTSHFSFYDAQIELQITSGELILPESFSHNDNNQRSSVKIGNQPLLLRYSNQQLLFQFSILIENIGVNLSNNGASNFSTTLEHTTLHLDSTKPTPWMTDTKGKITLPLDNQAALEIGFDEVEWDILGFPIGAIYLDQDVTFPLGGDFELTIKGGIDHGIETGLTISRDNAGLSKFILNGAIELLVPVDMLTMEDGEQIIISSSGNIIWQANKLPVANLEKLSIEGTFTLGGSNGIKIQDGLLAATGLNNILNPTESSPFELLLSGKVYLGEEGPGVGIKDARFTFTGKTYPSFKFGGLSVQPGEELLQSVKQLPLKVKELDIDFVQDIPLPLKLSPTNIRVTLSAELELSMPTGGNLLGMVDDISIHFNKEGIPIKKNGDIGIDIGGIGLGVEDFEAGTIVLTGTVYLSGLDKPEDLFFAGKLGGKINGTGINALLALGLDGPKGLCLDMSGGAAGIPLGPTGFLLTGAEGGVVFPNLDGKVSNADPCDIRTYISLNDDGHPVRMDQQIDSKQEVPNDEKVIQQASTKLTTAINEFTCPEGDCPPPAISIISQPHPDRVKYPDRVIVKFTSINKSVLDQIDLTESFFATFGGTDTPEEIANKTITPLFNFFDSNLPDLDSLSILDPSIRAEIEVAILKLKENIRNFLIETLTKSISAALSGNSSIYEAVKEIAYAGIPSPETTVKLTGSFSYAGVSTFLSITGGFSISTVILPTPVPLISTVGILGSIDVLGIPMGTANLFLNMTSPKGTPLLIPSLCGNIHASIGPVEFGQMKVKFAADGLLDGLVNAGAIFVEHLSEALIIQLLNLVDEKIVKDPHFNPEKPFDLLINDPQEASNKVVAVIGGLMNLPIEKEIRNCLIALMEDAWESFNPQFELCGQVQPKLFGFDLGGEIAGAMINIDKTSYKAKFSFSPSYIIGSLFGGILPAIDKASLGMAFELPDPIDMSKKLLGTENSDPLDKVEYLQEGFEHVLENAIYTIEYELVPMGLKMADAEARFIMPDLLDHPANPNSTWIRPENRSDRKYLSRLDLLTELLDKNLLANPLWKGTSDDLNQITNKNGDKTYNLSMKGYFPHGGMLGAAKLSLPIALLDGLPPQLIANLFNEKNKSGDEVSLIDRFNIAKELLDNYILKTRDIGRLAFYMPFPNPPTVTINGKTPAQLVQDMRESDFEWSDIETGDLLSKEVAFFEGYIDKAQILGIPVFNAKVTAYGADDAHDIAGRIEVSAKIPENSWFKEFIDNAELNFTLTQPPAVALNEYVREVINIFQQSIPQNTSNNNQVEIYSEPNYGGIKQSLGIGNYRTNELSIGNDELSSLKIPSNSDLLVILYEDDNFRGKKVVFNNNAKGLESSDDNIASSIRVVNKSQLAIEKLQTLFSDSLPKLKMEATLQGLKIPDSLSNFMKVNADTSLVARAYSPLYNPNAIGDSLDAELQRNGGIYFGYTCNFKVDGIFSVDKVKAELAVMPSSNNLVLPKLVGEFSVDEIDIPFSNKKLKDCYIYFNSEPNNKENIVAVKGNIPSIELGLFSLVSNVGGNISTSMSIANNPSAFNLQLSPVKIKETDFISADIKLHGATESSKFSVKSKGPWDASASVQNIDLGINLRKPNKLVILRVSNNIKGSIYSNNGFDNASLKLKIDSSTAIAFPNNSILNRDLISTNGRLDLTINSNGNFSITSEVSPFNFSLLKISGRNGQNLRTTLSNKGFSLNSSAELSIEGLTQKPYRLEEFTINTNGTFNVKSTGGKIGVRNFFELSGGSFTARRNNTNTALSIISSRLTLFPNTNMSNELSMGNCLIDSSGNFNISSNNKMIGIENLFTARGNFNFIKSGNKIQGKFEDVSVKLIPIGLSLEGNLDVNSRGITASLISQKQSHNNIIELPSLSWNLLWNSRAEIFSMRAKISTSLKIFNLPITPSGNLVITNGQNHFSLSISSKSNIPIISSVIEAYPKDSRNPAKLIFRSSDSQKYTLGINAKLRALRNPLNSLGFGDKWLISTDISINMSNGDFEQEITKHGSLINLPLFEIYSQDNCKTFFGSKNGSYYIRFKKLKISIIDKNQVGTVSGKVSTNEKFKASWDTPKDINLGIFKLPNRKLKLEMKASIVDPKFKLTIPAGRFIAEGIPGLSSNDPRVNIKEIKVGTDDFFTGLLNGFKLFGWLDLKSTINNGFNNFIKFNSKNRSIRVENKIDLKFGPDSHLQLDIHSNGSISGFIKGQFSIPSLTAFGLEFGDVDLGFIKLRYDGQDFIYTSQSLNLRGRDRNMEIHEPHIKNITLEDCDLLDGNCHARNLSRAAKNVEIDAKNVKIDAENLAIDLRNAARRVGEMLSIKIVVKFGDSGVSFNVRHT